MPILYHDTSALVKYYHRESGSAGMDGLFAEPNAYHFVSRLTLVELHSALALKVRTGVLTPDDFHRVCRKIESDWSEGTFYSIALTAVHLRSAEAFLRKHGLTSSLRTLDALQLVTALDIQGRGLKIQFVSADKNLCRIASIESLDVVNPDS